MIGHETEDGDTMYDVMFKRCDVTSHENQTHLLGTLKLKVGSDRDGEQVLVRVDDRVHDRDEGGDTGSQGDGGDGLGTGEEGVEEGLLLNIEDLGSKDGTVVVDLGDGHTVGEWRDVEHVQQGSFGRSDPSTGLDDLDVVDDFDCSSSDLGGDTKSLEERGLSWFHTGVSGWDVDIVRGVSTSSGWGGDLVADNDLSDILQVTRGEDESDVSLDVWEELLELRVLSEDDSETSSDHGVFTHEDDTFASEGVSNHVGLLGRDIVDVDQEDGCWDTSVQGSLVWGWQNIQLTVSLDESLELLEVEFLVGPGSSHFELIWCCVGLIR